MKDLRKENMELKRSLEFLQNYVQEVKSEVAQIKNMNKNNYSHSAFDGAIERIRIFEDSSRRKYIRITCLAKHENSKQIYTERNKLVSMTNLGWSISCP